MPPNSESPLNLRANRRDKKRLDAANGVLTSAVGVQHGEKQSG